ncbi:MAG: HAMP domain-containing histidine kinase [Myxococcales bacterium]|nr:HAMP domain-containing histidine kinase [Myxococcales bacterium]
MSNPPSNIYSLVSTQASTALLRTQLGWYLRLRTATLLGQIAVMAVAAFGVGVGLNWLPLLVFLVLFAATQAIALWSNRTSVAPDAGWLLGLLVFDIVEQAALLHFAGGPFNPFASVYVVYVAVAAMLLGVRTAVWCGVLALVGLGAVSVWHQPIDMDAFRVRHGDLAGQQLLAAASMVALSACTGCIVYFIGRVQHALGQREVQLADARARAARADSLAALTTLAAGAAHELSTPLSTIAVVAKDLATHLESAGLSPDIIDDVRLVRSEVDRCRTILHKMAARAGQKPGEALEPIAVGVLLERALAAAGLTDADIDIQPGVDVAFLRVPIDSLEQAVAGVLKNARQASPPGAPVRVRVRQGNGDCHIEVEDHGPGMAADVLARAGEPFFTLKEPGDGMGLGLFLTRAVVEQMGGSFALTSSAGAGTRALISVPFEPVWDSGTFRRRA